ncbi:MAG: FHA domain-containing protein [Sandaracinaceae bacterium]|nr:FHA domain-containing protein [Sandaracinaceae bacterium]
MASSPRGNGGGPENAGGPRDPFAAFEDDFEGDATRVEQEATSHEQPASHVPQLHPTLTVEAGPDVGKRFTIIVGETGIGRSIDNDVILTDIAVSRKHLKILRDDSGEVQFQDLGSGNGSTVNGVRVRNGVLRSGDRIEIGETRFILHIPSAAELRGARERTNTAPAGGGYDGDTTAPPQLGQHFAPMIGTGAAAGVARPVLNPQLAGAATVRPPAMIGSPQQPVMPSGAPQFSSPPLSNQQFPNQALPGQGFPNQGFANQGFPNQGFPNHAQPTAQHPAQAGVKHASPVIGRIIAAVVLLGTGVGIGMLFLNRPAEVQQRTDPPRPDASAFVTAGMAAYNARHLADAEAQFRQALAVTPNEPRAMQYLSLITEARAHEAKLTAARESFARGDGDATLAALNGLPESSLFHSEINVLRVSARDQIVARLLNEARAARRAGRTADARDRLSRAAGYDPTNADVVELARTIAPNGYTAIPPAAYVPPVIEPLPTNSQAGTNEGNSAGGSSSSSGSSRSGSRSGSSGTGSSTNTSGGLRTPIVGGDAFEGTSRSGGAAVTGVTADIRVLELYRSGDFSGAARYARTAASNASGGTAHRLADMASSIDRFTREYQRVRAAGSDTARVLRSIESAIALDQDISGGSAYAAQLRPLLVEATVAAAVTAWNGGQFTESCQKIRRASELDSRNATVRDYVRRCEQRATTVLQDAVAAERSNITQAQEMYRSVLTLVPASSASYRTAAARLSALGRSRPVDEDE